MLPDNDLAFGSHGSGSTDRGQAILGQKRPHGIRFSGIVVTFNEARRLSLCIESLRFCDEIIIVDLGSTDDSVAIARAHGAQVLHHPRVPHAELVRDWAMNHARNDWIALLDPDEVFPDGIDEFATRIIRDMRGIATIRVRFAYFFRGRYLTGTRWSLGWGAPRFCHRNRVTHPRRVHDGIRPKPGFINVNAWECGYDRCIRHYWVDSYHQLFEKHRRYLSVEGSRQFALGRRFWWKGATKATMADFYQNIWQWNGYRSFDGVFLSAFSAWYTFQCWMALRRYEREHSIDSAPERFED